MTAADARGVGGTFLEVHPPVREEDGSSPLYDSHKEPEACGRSWQQNVLHGETWGDGSWTATLSPGAHDIELVGKGGDLTSTAKNTEEWQEVVNSPAREPGSTV